MQDVVDDMARGFPPLLLVTVPLTLVSVPDPTHTRKLGLVARLP